MKNFLTGAFLMFTAITVVGLLVAGGTILYIIIGPIIPAWLKIILGTAAIVTVCAAPFAHDMGQAFYRWKNK